MNRPSRPPDLHLPIEDISFWWAERIQTNGDSIYRCNPDNWTWTWSSPHPLSTLKTWYDYSHLLFWDHYSHQITSSYAQYLLEQEILLPAQNT